MKKRIFFAVVICLFFIGNQMAGPLNPVDDRSSITHVGYESSEWQLNTVSNNVEFYYKVHDCSGQQAVFLRIVNKNDYEVQISWTEVFGDKVTGRTIEAFKGEKRLGLKAGQIIQEENCNENTHEECVTKLSMVTPTHVVDMVSFEITNIKITSLD